MIFFEVWKGDCNFYFVLVFPKFLYLTVICTPFINFLPLGHCYVCWQVNVYWTDNMLSDMTICFLLMLMCFCYGNHKLINEVQVNEHCGRWQFVSRSILYEVCDLLNKDRIWSLSFSFFLSFVDKSFQSWNNSSMELLPLWSLSYGSWIYNYMCNQCLSQLTLLVRILLRRGVLDTTLCDKVC